MPGRRKQRVASQIRFEIADLLERRTEDPRLRGLSVTGVEISPDLHQAFIYVSALSGQEGSQEALAGLKHASGFFRHELAERLDLRIVPELIFRWDASLETGERISHILDELAKSDDHT
jgi:ribosome-binding factor A